MTADAEAVHANFVQQLMAGRRDAAAAIAREHSDLAAELQALGQQLNAALAGQQANLTALVQAEVQQVGCAGPPTGRGATDCALRLCSGLHWVFARAALAGQPTRVNLLPGRQFESCRATRPPNCPCEAASQLAVQPHKLTALSTSAQRQACTNAAPCCLAPKAWQASLAGCTVQRVPVGLPLSSSASHLHSAPSQAGPPGFEGQAERCSFRAGLPLGQRAQGWHFVGLHCLSARGGPCRLATPAGPPSGCQLT